MTSSDNVKPQSRSKNMQMFLLFAVVIIILSTLIVLFKKPSDITQTILQQEIQQLQQQLPLRIDPYTELKKVEAGEMQIEYSFAVSDDPIKLSGGLSIKNDNFAQEVETAVKASACLNKNTRRYINNNVSLAYRYVNKDNITVANFIIPAGYCEN